MKISLTKCASAYLDIDRDTHANISSELIINIVPVSKSLGIGNAIVFLRDGTSLNVTESIGEIYLQLNVVKSYFELGFSKN